MIPRWHIFYGALFTILIWLVAPQTAWYNLALVFLASVFIDLDHYIMAVKHNGSFSLSKATKYYDDVVTELIIARHKKGLRMKEPHFHFFHTVEFMLLIALLGFVWEPFFYIFIGLVFHSLLDVYDLSKNGYLYIREWFFFNWLRKQF